MRRYLLVTLLITSFSAHALQSVRVGSQVLVVGDSAARVKELLGDPSVRGKSSGSNKNNARKGAPKSSGKRKGKGKQGKSEAKGETWQYRRDGHTTRFTIVDGKIAHIEDTAR
ncbi:DUF2845 domain-containing protein [Dyella monticola]|uniref:DUF2845 domain-containing protein n=1 Tax=Dyella monticola TaxID=1927958 RepID=A0A370WSI9_9GAMM|nr:DUF2845 domain-containing protein [Dyella monticola]RDS79090.1 DUF2845 domain-containing protein [Dyella monticola]